MLVADYEKQYEEYRNAHPLTEKEKNSPRFLEAQRRAEELRQRSMTAVEGGYQDEQGGFILDPMVQEQMNIAIERAQAQLALWDDASERSRAMPGEAYDSARFPNRDPMGKYSVIEMELEERYKRVRDMANAHTEEVGEYIGRFNGLERRLLNDPTAQLTRYRDLLEESKKYRLFMRAEKLCLDPAGRALLHQKALEVKNSPTLVRCDRYMQGLEYMVGLKRGPIPEEVLRAYREAGIELDMQMPERARQLIPTDEIAVEFENYDNGIYHRFAAMPENWGLTRDEIEGKFDLALNEGTLEPEFLEGSISPYAKATVDAYLEPYYIDTERANESGSIDRSTLIIVDGKTVRERMLEDYMAQNRAADKRIGDFENEYKADPALRYKVNEYVAAALMAGKRVEAFIPDADGRLPEQPTRLVKEGYTPSPLKKVTLSLWERFASKFGFYKEKVAEAKEYKRAVKERAAEEARMAQARERVKASYFCERSVNVNLSGDDARELFFGDYMRAHAGKMPENPLDLSMERSACQTLAACFMMKEMKDNGYSMEDIFDPQKLHAEKLAAGNAVAAMLDAGDKGGIAALLLAGQDTVVRCLEEKLANGLDLLDVQQLLKPENQGLVSMIKCGYDAVQEAQRPSIKEDYRSAFRNYMADRKLEAMAENARRDIEGNLRGVELPKVEFNANASEQEMFFDPISSTSQYMDYMLRGLQAGVELSSGLANERGAQGAVADFSSVVTMQAVRQAFRDAQAEKPNVPFCRLLAHNDLADSGVVGFGAIVGMTDEFIDMKLRVEADEAMQKELGHDVLSGRIDERIEVGIRGEFSCKFRESAKAAESEKKQTKEKAAPERGRSR